MQCTQLGYKAWQPGLPPYSPLSNLQIAESTVHSRGLAMDLGYTVWKLITVPKR